MKQVLYSGRKYNRPNCKLFCCGWLALEICAPLM